VGGQRHALAALPPANNRYPLYRRLGGPQGRSGRVRKISSQPGFDSLNVRPVVSRCTDWDIPAHQVWTYSSYTLGVILCKCLLMAALTPWSEFLTSWSSSFSQEIPRILWNPEVYYCPNKNLPLARIQNQTNPVHAAPPSFFFKLHFNITLSSQISHQKYVSIYLPHVPHMTILDNGRCIVRILISMSSVA